MSLEGSQPGECPDGSTQRLCGKPVPGLVAQLGMVWALESAG